MMHARKCTLKTHLIGQENTSFRGCQCVFCLYQTKTAQRCHGSSNGFYRARNGEPQCRYLNNRNSAQTRRVTTYRHRANIASPQRVCYWFVALQWKQSMHGTLPIATMARGRNGRPSWSCFDGSDKRTAAIFFGGVGGSTCHVRHCGHLPP